jgi:hypothetical protein
MKKLTNFTLTLLLVVAPFLGAGLSSCNTSDGTDPLMKTTRLNESTMPTKKSDDKKKDKQSDKPKVQSFQTNYPITI